MRLLIVSQHFWPESFRINELAQALRRHGCEITVLTGQPNYPEGKLYPGYSAASVRCEDWDGIEIFRVPLIPRGRGGALRLAANYISYLMSATLFGSWVLRGRQFDAILVYGTSPILQAIPAIMLRKFKGCCLATWVQDLWPESLSVTGHVSNAWVLCAVDHVVRWIYKKNDLLLGQSRSFVEVIRRKSPDSRVIYFPNPGERILTSVINPHNFGPGFHIVFAGNVGMAQSVETIVCAANEISHIDEVFFHIFGYGSKINWISEKIEQNGLKNIILHGRVDYGKIQSVFSGASALLVTLNKEDILTQTVPSKIQSYLQAGRPIIASLDGEGAAVVADAQAGLVCPAEDVAALAAAVRQMYLLPQETRTEFGNAGKRYFGQHFDLDVLAERLIGVLNRCGEIRRERVEGEEGE